MLFIFGRFFYWDGFVCVARINTVSPSHSRLVKVWPTTPSEILLQNFPIFIIFIKCACCLLLHYLVITRKMKATQDKSRLIYKSPAIYISARRGSNCWWGSTVGLIQGAPDYWTNIKDAPTCCVPDRLVQVVQTVGSTEGHCIELHCERVYGNEWRR